MLLFHLASFLKKESRSIRKDNSGSKSRNNKFRRGVDVLEGNKGKEEGRSEVGSVDGEDGEVSGLVRVEALLLTGSEEKLEVVVSELDDHSGGEDSHAEDDHVVARREPHDGVEHVSGDHDKDKSEEELLEVLVFVLLGVADHFFL